MAISHHIKDIGRGAAGARALTRAAAADLLGQILDGHCSDLEIGAFCVAMRIKGETPEEMAGFLDALDARLHKLPASERPVVVLPSYNGARKLPVLTPLLAALLAREGLPVLMHGCATEDRRISTQEVLAAGGVLPQPADAAIACGQLHFVATDSLHAGLARLLDVRRAIGLRNPAHSLVKLMNPVRGPALVIGSYTHPEYATSMAATFELIGANALLLRGTEGEPVADPRRSPRMELFLHGQASRLQEAQSGPLAALPALPEAIDAHSTHAFIAAVLAGEIPVPTPIAEQIGHIMRACEAIEAATQPAPARRLAA